jgi:hypothetical protein
MRGDRAGRTGLIFSEDAARINPWPKITGLAAAASARCRLLFSR